MTYGFYFIIYYKWILYEEIHYLCTFKLRMINFNHDLFYSARTEKAGR